MIVKAVNKKVKVKKVKKKKQVVAPISVSKAQGVVTYSKVSGNKKIKVNDKININIEKLNQNWIAKCNFVNFTRIKVYFLIIAIFLLIL